MVKAVASKIEAGLRDALAYARVDALWRTTKKKRGQDISQYDWGYRDGLFAARSLFGTTVKPKAKGTKTK